MSVPARPLAFNSELPPPGFALKLISFWRDRPIIQPRLQLVHTNWAQREGTIQAAWNWANAGGGNTIPHFQIDRSGAGAMLLPLNRQGIANYKAAPFSIGIETADRGQAVDPPPVGSWFTDAQAEAVAVALAYSAWGFGIALTYPDRWDGRGSACHTEPFGYPYWTNSSAKACPGERKKQQMCDVVIPRARQILTAWTAPPKPVTVTPISIPSEDDMPVKCVNRDGGYWLYDKIRKTPLIYPGNDLALIALLWDLEDDGVKFGGHDGTKPRGIPIPEVLNDWEWPTFDAAPTG